MLTSEPVRLRALILACCIASGSAWSREDLFGLPADAAPEDLYWEVLRLRTSDLLSEQVFAQVQRELDVIDSHYSTDRDRDDLVRRVLAGALRRTYQTGTDGENAALLHAQEGRAYARRLHHAGVRESEKYAQRTVLIAGMLGVPTSKEELALIVVLPVGGYIVGKVVGFTYKRAALLLRKLRTPEEVLARAGALGIRVERIESRAGVERLLGKDAAAGIDSAPRASESLITGAPDTVERGAGAPRSPTRMEAAGAASKLLGSGTSIGEKVAAQMAKRGWTRERIETAIRDPVRTVTTRDVRHLPGGQRLNDPATAFYSREGGYVVRNNRTGDIVQVSDRFDPNWRAPWD